jgi:hypothetical protein
LCCLGEPELEELARAAERRLIPVSRYREPDMDNQLTAIVIGPSGKSLVSRLPLALRPKST